MDNYIYVDFDQGVIRVYDSLGEIEPKDFDNKFDAFAYAAEQAKEQGCEWGSN